MKYLHEFIVPILLRFHTNPRFQQVKNQKLQNEYLKSDAFLELAARRQFNRAAPGEKLLIVPKSVAEAKVPDKPVATVQVETAATTTSHWQEWLRFLSGRALR